MKININYMKIGMNYMENRYQLYENRYELYENYIELLLMSDNYLNDSNFLLLIFEIFVDLPLIIGIIYRRKYELINKF